MVKPNLEKEKIFIEKNLIKLFKYDNGDLYKADRNGKYYKLSSISSGRVKYIYWDGAIDGIRISMLVHRIVFYVHNGYFPECVDHINGNSLDNRIENLRACTLGENGMNSRKQRGSTSDYKGVAVSAKCGLDSRRPWLAYHCIREEIHKLGNYETETEAAVHRDLQIILRGKREFERLNFPELKDHYKAIAKIVIENTL